MESEECAPYENIAVFGHCLSIFELQKVIRANTKNEEKAEKVKVELA